MFIWTILFSILHPSIYQTIPLLPLCSLPPVTHCVLWDRNCSRLKVSFSSGWTGSHQRPGKWTPGWCCHSLATYQEYVIIWKGRKGIPTNSVQIFVSNVISILKNYRTVYSYHNEKDLLTISVAFALLKLSKRFYFP